MDRELAAARAALAQIGHDAAMLLAVLEQHGADHGWLATLQRRVRRIIATAAPYSS